MGNCKNGYPNSQKTNIKHKKRFGNTRRINLSFLSKILFVETSSQLS